MDGTKNTETDLAGRVMSLEQKFRGLHGRVSALEMRLSPGASGEDDIDEYDLTEFVACGNTGISGGIPDSVDLEDRVRSLEERLGRTDASVQRSHAEGSVHTIDITGLIMGISMIAIGILLSTNSLDMLKNPMLAFVCGVSLLAYVTFKAIKK